MQYCDAPIYSGGGGIQLRLQGRPWLWEGIGSLELFDPIALAWNWLTLWCPYRFLYRPFIVSVLPLFWFYYWQPYIEPILTLKEKLYSLFEAASIQTSQRQTESMRSIRRAAVGLIANNIQAPYNNQFGGNVESTESIWVLREYGVGRCYRGETESPAEPESSVESLQDV